MKPITVVDARMGRGKSSAAIRYMNRHKGSKRFLYITPYLDEVSRICEQCSFDQTADDNVSKSADLKRLLHSKKNIAATHSLFYLMDESTLDIICQNRYCLIIDESVQVIEHLNISDKDYQIVMEQFVTADEDGKLTWNDSEYTGRFSDYKAMADTGSLFNLNHSLLSIMNPNLLRAFDEIFMLTYLFDGQYQKGYLEYFGFEYRVVGVECDDKGYFFSDRPDNPPPIDYGRLINLVDDKKNNVGNSKYALSKNWFMRRGYNHPDIKALRSGLRSFYRSNQCGGGDCRLWTSFKIAKDKIVDNKTGRFNNDFLQVSARATNEYRNKTDVAYLANRFMDANLVLFFARKDVNINSDKFALSEMLQWIWRSAIRDDKPINLYIPSRRMRSLLLNWIKENNKGENSANE